MRRRRPGNAENPGEGRRSSPAQLAILQMLSADISVAEIARQYPARRSITTIRSHVQRVYAALGVNSRTAAVLKAREYGLL